MSLERVSVGTKEGVCNSHLGLYTNLDPQISRFRTALSASAMSISACHLGHFFAILKTQVSEKLGPPLPSVSSHRLAHSWFSNRPLHATCYLQNCSLDGDSTQRTRKVRECCAMGSTQVDPIRHLAPRKSGHQLLVPQIWCSLGLMAASS